MGVAVYGGADSMQEIADAVGDPWFNSDFRGDAQGRCE